MVIHTRRNWHLWGCLALSLLRRNALAADQETNRYRPYPQVEAISEGIAWPQGQALPIFATPAAMLDTFDVESLAVD